MIDHIWSIVCGRSTTDRESGNISIFDVVEQVNVLGPLPDPATRPAIPMQYEIVSLWARQQLDQPEEAQARVRLIGPNNAEILGQGFAVNLTQHVRMRTQLRSIGFPVVGTGIYTFYVDIQRANEEWENVSHIPVQVVTMAQPPAPAAGA
jgi:hypothetical protein